MQGNYGITGGALIAAWKREYDEIAKDVRFGGANAETAFDGLKQKISDTVDQYIQKGKRWKLVFWIALVAIIPCVLIFGLSGVGSWVPLISIIVCVVGYFSKKGCYQVLEAAYNFDEAIFGGEIFYRRRNG